MAASMFAFGPAMSQDVAAVDLGLRQDRNVDRSSTASDLVQVNASREIGFGQLEQCLAVIGLVGQHHIDGFRRHIEQLGVGNLVAEFPEHFDQRFGPAGNSDDISLLQDGCRCELDDLAVSAQPLNEEAVVRASGLGVAYRRSGRKTISDLVGANVKTAIRGLHATRGRADRHFFFISLALGLHIDAEQLRAQASTE